MGQQLYRLPQDVIATVQAGEALHAEWGVGEPSGLAGRTAVPLSLLLDLVKQHRSIRVVSYYSSSGVPSAEYVTLMRAGGTTARAWAEKRVMQDTVGPVYVSRPVVNAPDIVAWAKSHGYRSVVPAESMHVTIAYSRAAVDWSLVGCADDVVTIPSSPARSLREFSDDAKVLVFESEALRDRHLQIRELGASWDHPEYHPHITLTRGPSPDTDALEPYDGPIVLGPELLAPLSDDWRAGMVEKMIRAENGKWVVYDHEGETRLGTYDTRAEAVGRLAQIEAHKKSLMENPMRPIYKDGDVGQDFETAARVLKVDEGLGLVMGYAIVCTKGGRPYYDLQGDHIPESAMLKAATDFMSNSRLAKDMHDGEPVGDVLFAFPLTGEVAKAFGITTDTTGLMIAMRPGPEMLAKFKSGEYTGFSIGGRRVVDEEVD